MHNHAVPTICTHTHINKDTSALIKIYCACAIARVVFESMAAKKTYTASDLENAVAEMQQEEATSMRAVAFKYGIPPTTLHDHLKRKATKIGAGGPTVFTHSEEQEIALTCVTLADM